MKKKKIKRDLEVLDTLKYYWNIKDISVKTSCMIINQMLANKGFSEEERLKRVYDFKNWMEGN